MAPTTESCLGLGERGATAAARTRAMAAWSTAVYSKKVFFNRPPGRAAGACAAAHRSVCGRAGNQGAARRFQGARPMAGAALERTSRPPTSAAGQICTAGGADRVRQHAACRAARRFKCAHRRRAPARLRLCSGEAAPTRPVFPAHTRQKCAVPPAPVLVLPVRVPVPLRVPLRSMLRSLARLS